MKLNLNSLSDKKFWQAAKVALPRYDVPAVAEIVLRLGVSCEINPCQPTASFSE